MLLNLEHSTHCYGHALNLVQDTLNSIKDMEQCLETLHEITNLQKNRLTMKQFLIILRMKFQVMPILEFVCYVQHVGP